MNTVHLWRIYPNAPVYRWACEVAEAPEAPDGYRVVRHDPIVADSAFFHRLAAALTAPAEGIRDVTESSGLVATTLVQTSPGDEGHFGLAVRMVKGAITGQSPERMAALNAPKGAA